MRVLLAVVGVVLAVAGCGGDDEPDAPARSALAEQLATLCDETRVAVEELGEPKDEGAAIFKPWAEVGDRFVADVRGLSPTTARQRNQLERLATYYAGFFDNLRKSYDLHRAGSSVAVKPTLERAYALLASGEQIAVRIGAPECAVRPFVAES